MVQEIRDKREKEKNEKMLIANEKYFRKMKYIQKTHDKLRQEKLQKIIEERNKNESEGGKGSDRGSNKSAGRDLLLPN